MCEVDLKSVSITIVDLRSHVQKINNVIFVYSRVFAPKNRVLEIITSSNTFNNSENTGFKRCSQLSKLRFSIYMHVEVNEKQLNVHNFHYMRTDDSRSSRELKFPWELRLAIALGLIHDSRHVGFQIVMQIAMCYAGGQTLE